MTTVREAKQIAKDWVEAEAPNIPNFRGAFLTGSILWKEDADPFPSTSDVDLVIVVDNNPDDPIFRGRLAQKNQLFKGIILETAASTFEKFSTPEQVLADFAYASHFSVTNFLFDPSGKLSEIQKVVRAHFAQKQWVVKRIEGARDFTLWSLNALQAGSIPDRMLALVFTFVGVTQIPVHADLKPPTGRKCGIVFLDVLQKYRKPYLHQSALELLGSNSMKRVDVERHLQDLSNAFDRTVEIARSPSLGDKVNKTTRSVVIDGAWEVINAGFHREAMSWIASIRAMCQKVILRDGSDEEKKIFIEQYQELLAELELHSEDDIQKRAEDGRRLLDEVIQVAMQIVETNPKIVR